MGHLGRLKQEYRDLLARLERGTVALPEPDDERARAGLQEILEILYTPEEAALAVKLPVRPTPLEKLALRTGQPAEALRPRLEAMADKGLVLDLVDPKSGETSWMLSPPVVGWAAATGIGRVVRSRARRVGAAAAGLGEGALRLARRV